MSNKRKITFISSVTTPERAYENIPELKDFDVKFFQMHESSKRVISEAPDTEFIIADAMGRVDGELISSLKSLKLIQSEGVGYQGIDLECARKCGVTVCNNKGINDTAVAECTVFLILACLKNYENGVRALYKGKQIEAKKRRSALRGSFPNVLSDLSASAILQSARQGFSTLSVQGLFIQTAREKPSLKRNTMLNMPTLIR